MSDSISIYLVKFNIGGRQGFLGHYNNDGHNETGRPFAWVNRDEAEAEAHNMREANPGNTYEVETIDPRGLTAALAFDATLTAERDAERANANEAILRAERLTTERDNERARCIAMEGQLAAAKQRHEADVARIGAQLLDEAENRSWCSEYDDIVDSLNRDLHVELPLRRRDYDVTFTVEVTVPIRVTARDEDTAHQRAWNELDLDSVRAALSNLGGDACEFDRRNYEVELADDD